MHGYAAQPGVSEIWVTGSDRTFDAIVFGNDSTKSRPRIEKPIVGELGNVCPVIVVPGPWNAGDLAYHAELIATGATENAGFTCSIPRVIVQHATWDRRASFLDQLRHVLADVPLRDAYYPGSPERRNEFLREHPEAESFGKPTGRQLPWTLVPGLDPEKVDDVCFKKEAFFGFFAETGIAALEAASFVDRAVAFANEHLWGTLSAIILVHPASLKSPAVASAVRRAIETLRYGTIAVNYIAGANWAAGVTPWGAFPNANIRDIQSGNGVVHNALMFDKPQKVVVRAPFRARPKPVWFTSRGGSRRRCSRDSSTSRWTPPPGRCPASSSTLLAIRRRKEAEMKTLRGKNALVTGASYGLGVRIAEALVREGGNVALLARSADRLRQVAESLKSSGAGIVVCPADITDEAERRQALSQAEESLGQIDILINNAGIVRTAPFAHQARDDVSMLLATNLAAPLFLALELLPEMIERGSGHIVSISSLSGKKGVLNEATYATTKAALIEWTSGVRMEIEGTGVGISVVCPIYISDSGEMALYNEKAPWLAGSTTSETVANAVVKAIKRDLQEVIVRPSPTRPLLALNALSPSLGTFIIKCTGVPKLQRRLADHEAARRSEARS